jgi:lipopolysaccharide heptosyltransferase I
MMSREGQSPRILLVRLSAIGDLIHAMPVAVAIRRHYPAAYLAWAVEERAAPLLEGHPAIDERIVLPRGWLRSPGKVLSLRRQLKSHKFDTAIDAQGLTKSAAVSWLSGAPRRIGMDGRWGRELSRWLNNTLVATDDLHAIERGLQLLAPLDISSPAVEFQLTESAADGRVAEETIHRLGLGRDFVLLISGAGWPSKLWPVERYAAVAEYLGRKLILPTLLVWGNDAERSRAERIAAASAGHAVLSPRVTLKELAALARRARFAIGSDTGPLHLAAAVGTRCIGLYGPWPADKHGPYGPHHINLQKMCMDGTTSKRRHAPAIYMEAIGVATVCAACDRMTALTSKEIVCEGLLGS